MSEVSGAEMELPPEWFLPQPRHALALFLLILLLQVVLTVLLGFVVGLWAAVAPEAALDKADLMAALLILLASGALVWLVVWFTRRQGFHFRDTLALRPAPAFAWLWAVVGGLALTTLAEALLVGLFPSFFRPLISQQLEPFSSFSPLALSLYLLGITLGAGIGEELAFRGFILTGLGSRLSGGAAVVLTAGLFAIAHLNLPHAVLVFPLGVWLGAVVCWTGSVYPAMALHVVNNAMAVGWLRLFPQSGDNPFSLLPWWGYPLCLGVALLAGRNLRRLGSQQPDAISPEPGSPAH